ncbi:vancomycin resistance protein YoaR [Ruminiclostridium sufflavum DSM 19573]|uniref:Vancomycin resistance protein YoaR n=1 Tax=Ruminiclostridium sufflavum DSM 19573 TaxID=1121337 RepID=A0A318XPC8_9FIRM|nr:VanW family protein [Ruminiclostridium sufflavum]PYG87529.1 vancomycin resistance protein YoaR [Ruminiclostridium sufflavum DSM 19573]
MYKHLFKRYAYDRRNQKAANSIITVFLIILILVNMVFGISAYRKLTYKYFYSGIYVDGIKISGMARDTAKKRLQEEFAKSYNSRIILLKYNEKSWPLPLEGINYLFDFEATLDYAYKIGREGGIIHRLKTILRINKKPVNLIVSAKYDTDKLAEKLDTIKKEIDFLGISSTYNYNCGKINYTKAVEGRNLDIDLNRKLVDSYLLNRNFKDINLIVQPVKPQITTEDVKEIKDVLAVYTTNFNANNYSRAYNIKLACKKINNYLVLPGEEFSMDLALGPRTTAHGFMEAPIIMKSTVVRGTGGGVCQVTSTLYNTVLLSMLKVTGRVNHSIALNYVPLGQDATISEGYIDFKFKNNRDYTICIATEAGEGNVTVKIIGRKRNDDPSVKLRPVIVEEYAPPYPEYIVDESLSDAQVVIRTKEKKGFKVVLYRDTYNSQGSLIDTEKISQDIYKPVRGVLAVNRKVFKALKK